jgi:toxin ParE1/3/4
VPGVIWTPQARLDLEAIEEYYLEVAPNYAELMIDGLLAAVRRLQDFPDSGRLVPELREAGLREVIYRSYRVIYYHNPEHGRVEVLSVLHTSRLLGHSRP